MTPIFTKVVKSIALPALIMGLTSVNIYAQQADTTSAKTASQTAAENSKRGYVTVKGLITDARTQKPVPGINVQVIDYAAAITDEKGEFSISVPNLEVTLTISGPGYQNKEIPLLGRTDVSASLYEDTYNSVYDQVVLPYSTKSKLHVANAVDAVNTTDRWQRSGESSDTYLQGRMPGLNVVRRSGTPGIGANLFLNGFTSLYATNQPLIVVDGMLYDNASYGSSLLSGHVGNPLSNIDIKDVDSYTLIKDGSSIYGTRGANGVLLITTSHAKTQATAIDFAAYGAYNSKVSNLPVMDANDFRVYLSDMLKTVPGQTDASIQMKPYMIDDPSYPGYYNYHNNTDWQDQVMSNSYSQNYYLKITGGDDIATYGLSVGYLKQSGIIDNTNLQRYQTRFNADLNLSTRLTSGISLSFVNNQENLQNQGIAPKTSPMFLALIKAPFLAPHTKNAQNEESPNFADYDSLGVSNPSALINKMQGINNNFRFLGSINFKYQFSKKVALQTLLGVNFDKIRESTFIPGHGVVPDTLLQAITTNSSATNTQRLYSLYNDTHASFSTHIGSNQSFSANLGFRYNTSNREIDFGHGYNSATDDYVSVTGGQPGLRVVGGENGKWNWLNIYANANYELLDRYFFTFNIASDGSSRFGKSADAPLTVNGNKFSLMPSIAGGWLISSEKFMSDVKFVDALKLRASYGIVGNDDIGNYSATQYYVSQNYLGSQGLVRGNIANPALKWESVKKTDAGIDAAFLNERLGITFDYFNNISSNMITYEPIVSVGGFQYVLTNNSAMKTHGMSLGINGRIINSSKLTWDLGVNLSHYKNIITKAPNNMFLSDYADGTFITEVGQAANLFYGFKTNGVYATDAEAAASHLQNRREDGTVTNFRGGDVRFVDANHDGYIDNADRQVIGDPNPDITGGISTSVTYKRWSMDAIFTFSSGNDIYNYTRRVLMGEKGYENQLDAANNRWRAQGQVTNVPRAEYADPAGNSRFSDRWIEDGSYLRLRTISIAYNIPLPFKGIKSAKIYVTGNNVFTVTNYLGYDPEFSADGNIFSQGTDIGLEPQFRTIQIGIRVGL